MSALTLTLNSPLQHRLNMSAITPNQLANLSLKQIADIRLPYGRDSVRLEELFSIQGNDTQHIVLRNTSALMDNIGQDQQAGRLEIHGDVGHYLGLNMRGEITLHGNAGNFAGCQMQSGLLHITGNAGDYAGGALIGNRKGMRGGTLIINGNVGDRCGEQMRRGTILVDGHAGDYCAVNMLAGTIAVAGKVGRNCAYAMKRGTVLLQHTPKLHASMVNAGQHQLGFLSLMAQSWREYPSQFSQLNCTRVSRYCGDTANQGRGEILVICPD
jgi:formylmethanofuran dehydrogenase subunit C